MTTIEKTSQRPTFPLTVRRKMVGYEQRLAERIVEAREQKGWSRRELAFHAQVSDKTIERLEEAKVSKPRAGTLRAIAEATDREVSDIRPDMETEEKNLRAQLTRIETKLDEALALLRLADPEEEAAKAAEEAAQAPNGTPGRSSETPPATETG